jgi:hypothetical protein
VQWLLQAASSGKQQQLRMKHQAAAAHAAAGRSQGHQAAWSRYSFTRGSPGWPKVRRSAYELAGPCRGAAFRLSNTRWGSICRAAIQAVVGGMRAARGRPKEPQLPPKVSGAPLVNAGNDEMPSRLI